MKTLILMRHAKSDWSNQKLNDFDRPLNKRGYKDALNAGKFLKKFKLIPDLIISSSSKRTLLTSKIIAKKINFKENNIIFDDSLYDTKPSYYLNLLRSIDDKVSSVLLIGHNPELQETFLKLLFGTKMKKNDLDLKSYVNKVSSINITTASMLFLCINFEKWKKVNFGSSYILNYITPKNIVDYIKP